MSFLDLFFKVGTERELEMTKLKLWEIITSVFKNPKIIKIFFDAKFAYKLLMLKFGIPISLPIKDCLIDAHLYENGIEKSAKTYTLEKAVDKYLRFELFQMKNTRALEGSSMGWIKPQLNQSQLICASR